MVDYKEYIVNCYCYVIKFECIWFRGKVIVIFDFKEGLVKLCKDGYNVVVRIREKGGYLFVIFSLYEVVY